MFIPHNRRSIRLKGYNYSQSGLYFVTICTFKKQCIFGDIENGKMVLSPEGIVVGQCWNEIPEHFPNVVLHDFVIMPNHIHGIIEITDAETTGVKHAETPSNVGAKHFSPLHPVHTPQSLASIVSREQIRPTGTSRTVGSIVRGFKIGVTKNIGFSPWQRNYYETIIRNDNSYKTIAQYIEQNPAKWEFDRFYENK